MPTLVNMNHASTNSTARLFRGALCGKTARRDLRGGYPATGSPTLMCAKHKRGASCTVKVRALQTVAKEQLPSVALMIAKSLKLSGSLLTIETGSRCSAPDGWMAKHHRRSVHREVSRPQGARSPQRQFSPVKRLGDVDDDGVNVRGSQYRRHRNGEMQADPSGFEAVAWIQRSGLELGRPVRPPQRRTGASTNGRCI